MKQLFIVLTLIFSASCMNEIGLLDSWKEFEITVGQDRLTANKLVDAELFIEGNNKVDIVFVVDNSGSMIEEHESIYANFNSFVSNLDEDIDVLMALTTSDGYAQNDNTPQFIETTFPYCGMKNKDIQMIGHRVYNNANLLDAANYLNPENIINYIGIGGCPNERPLYFAYNLFLNNMNLNKFRQNSHKIIIIITDEDERAACGVNI